MQLPLDDSVARLAFPQPTRLAAFSARPAPSVHSLRPNVAAAASSAHACLHDTHYPRVEAAASGGSMPDPLSSPSRLAQLRGSPSRSRGMLRSRASLTSLASEVAHPLQPSGHQVVTTVNASLPLQALLYYQGIFSAVYALLIGRATWWKMTTLRLGLIEGAILPASMALWILVEPVRLRFGYTGNRSEETTQLSAFLILSGFPQIPAVVYISWLQAQPLPIEPLLGTIQILFLLVELVLAWKTVKLFIDKQTSLFVRMCHDEQGGAARRLAEEALSRKRMALLHKID
eukprot:PLAT8639.1.p1 GENE.PLAT8639.1~~PLAT8639.1.p1  ORF type:complete len:288 (+),score=95.38 PLAT8639.1:177-1040(+)